MKHNCGHVVKPIYLGCMLAWHILQHHWQNIARTASDLKGDTHIWTSSP